MNTTREQKDLIVRSLLLVLAVAMLAFSTMLLMKVAGAGLDSKSSPKHYTQNSQAKISNMGHEDVRTLAVLLSQKLDAQAEILLEFQNSLYVVCSVYTILSGILVVFSAALIMNRKAR